jgi:hypothetical protein
MLKPISASPVAPAPAAGQSLAVPRGWTYLGPASGSHTASPAAEPWTLERWVREASPDVLAPCLTHLDERVLVQVLKQERILSALDAPQPSPLVRPPQSLLASLQIACRTHWLQDQQDLQAQAQDAPIEASETQPRASAHPALFADGARGPQTWHRQLLQRADLRMQLLRYRHQCKSTGYPTASLEHLALGWAMRAVCTPEPSESRLETPSSHGGRGLILPPPQRAYPLVPTDDAQAHRRAWQLRATEALILLNLAGPKGRAHYLGEAAAGTAQLLLGEAEDGLRRLQRAWSLGGVLGHDAEADPRTAPMAGPAAFWCRRSYGLNGEHSLLGALKGAALHSGSVAALNLWLQLDLSPFFTTPVRRLDISNLMAATRLGQADLLRAMALHQAPYLHARDVAELYELAQQRQDKDAMAAVLPAAAIAQAAGLEFDLNSELGRAGLPTAAHDALLALLSTAARSPAQGRAQARAAAASLTAAQGATLERHVAMVAETAEDAAAGRLNARIALD